MLEIYAMETLVTILTLCVFPLSASTKLHVRYLMSNVGTTRCVYTIVSVMKCLKKNVCREMHVQMRLWTYICACIFVCLQIDGCRCMSEDMSACRFVSADECLNWLESWNFWHWNLRVFTKTYV